MSDYINKVGSKYNINVKGTNLSPKDALQPVDRQIQNDKKQISELSSTMNPSVIRTPMSYIKTGEVDLPYGFKASCYKLSNGQKVVIIPKEGETVLKTYVNTGSMNEMDNIRGISHYIEHNLFNGSDGLEAGEFFKTTDKMGADTNASTGMAETNYYIASHLLNQDDLEKKIKIHASMLESPRFALDMLEKEKGVVNSEINMVTSNPENMAYNNTIKTLFNIKTTSGDVIAGTTNNITNITREDVVKYYNNNYYPANMVTVVSGEVTPEETMKLLSKYFSSTKQPPSSRYHEKLEPVKNVVRQDIISDKAHSTFVAVGFAGPENNNSKDRVYIDALGKLLFNMNNAQKKFEDLNTSVFCLSEKVGVRPSDKRAIMLTADVSEENSEKLLKLIYSQINKYQYNGVTDEEFMALKRSLRTEYANMFEYSSVINNLVGESILEGCLDGVANYEKILDEMTPQDLMNTAKKYFNLKQSAITVLHPDNVNTESLNRNYNAIQNVSFTGALKKQAVNLKDVRQYNLPNNFRAVLKETSIPYSVLDLSFDTTKQIKAKNPAAYAVLSALLDEGSIFNTREELEAIKENNGILTGFSAGNDGIAVSARFDVSEHEKVFDIIKEVVENPRFDEATFKNVKAKLADSLTREEHTPENKLNPELYPGSYFAKEDILKGLETLSLDDVKNLYFAIMSNSMAAMTMSAPFKEKSELKNNVLSKLNTFGVVKPFEYKKYENYVPQLESKVFTDIANKTQAKIVMAYKYQSTGNLKDDVTIRLLNTILGGGPSSRLFEDLREKQKLAYSVRSKISQNGDTGVIKLSIGTTTDNKETGEKSFDNLQKSINGFKNHVEKLKSELVSQEELDSAKLSVKNTILSLNESVSGKNATIEKGLHSYYGLGMLNQFLEVVDEITVEDIYNAAHYIFKDKPVYSIVATNDTLKYNKEYLDNLKRA